jgi:hypothetical protein
MFAHHGRKVMFAALLATTLSAPAWAIDSVTTAQQTALGHAETEMAALQTGPVVAQESYATVTNGRIAEPPARPKASAVRLPTSPARQPNADAGYYRSAERGPLILGIRY